MYSSYNKLRKSSCDIMPHRKNKKLCVMMYRLILSYITYKIVLFAFITYNMWACILQFI